MQANQKSQIDIDLEAPIVVYAVDAPTYDERAIELFGPTPAPPHLFHGNAIVVTGGGLRYKQQGNSAIPYVCLTGLIGLTEDPSDLRYAEDIITAMIEASDRVTLMHPKADQEPTSWPNNARAAGLEVFEAADAVVCVGHGESLRRFHWAEEPTSMGFTILASRDSDCPLARALVSASQRRGRVGDVIRDCWSRMHTDPGVLEDALEGCHLYAGERGPDQGNIVILRTQTDVSDIGPVLSQAAERRGFPLYDAGGLTVKGETGFSFADFEQWHQWKPLPASWKRVT